MNFIEPEGATPIDSDERQGLKHGYITTRGELDELEQANIEDGLMWAARRREFDIFDDAVIRDLHKRLFGDVWDWAGKYRLTEKNIGVDPRQIAMQLPFPAIEQCLKVGPAHTHARTHTRTHSRTRTRRASTWRTCAPPRT